MVIDLIIVLFLLVLIYQYHLIQYKPLKEYITFEHFYDNLMCQPKK